MEPVWQLALLLTWLGSLLLGAFLGYERGRWQTGLLLGLFLGPLGALAAGLLVPSLAWECRRRYLVHQQVSAARKADERRARERRREAAEFSKIADNLKAQIDDDRMIHTEQLDHLANELERIVETKSVRKPDLATWISWLRDQSQTERSRRSPAGPIDSDGSF